MNQRFIHSSQLHFCQVSVQFCAIFLSCRHFSPLISPHISTRFSRAHKNSVKMREKGAKRQSFERNERTNELLLLLWRGLEFFALIPKRANPQLIHRALLWILQIDIFRRSHVLLLELFLFFLSYIFPAKLASSGSLTYTLHEIGRVWIVVNPPLDFIIKLSLKLFSKDNRFEALKWDPQIRESRDSFVPIPKAFPDVRHIFITCLLSTSIRRNQSDDPPTRIRASILDQLIANNER